MPSLKIRLLFIFSTILYLFSSTVIPTFANISYTYDADGNMTSDAKYCYSYNEENQLMQVKDCGNNQVIAQYIYDYQGNRLIKKNYVNGTLNNTVYSPEDEYETRKIASNGAIENTSYYFANNQQLAKKNPDGSKTFVHNDDLGSSSVLSNQSGTAVETTTYDPWGEVKSGGTKDKFQYTGQEKDSETGLHYYNSRYYNSHVRRFIQPDSLLPDIYNPQALNRYSYVNNNPLRYTDPSGHCPLCVIAVAVVAPEAVLAAALGVMVAYAVIPQVRTSINNGIANIAHAVISSMSTVISNAQKTTPVTVNNKPPTTISTNKPANNPAPIQNNTPKGPNLNPFKDIPKSIIAGTITYTAHAIERMEERNISGDAVIETLQNGIVKTGNYVGASAYQLGATASSTGRGIVVIFDDMSNNIITVIDKGSKFIPKL